MIKFLVSTFLHICKEHELFQVLTSMESYLSRRFFIQDYTAAINQACSGSDVEDSKLKTTWLIILI